MTLKLVTDRGSERLGTCDVAAAVREAMVACRRAEDALRQADYREWASTALLERALISVATALNTSLGNTGANH